MRLRLLNQSSYELGAGAPDLSFPYRNNCHGTARRSKLTRCECWMGPLVSPKMSSRGAEPFVVNRWP